MPHRVVGERSLRLRVISAVPPGFRRGHVVPSYLGDKGMDLFDQGCALVRVHLVELQTILAETQNPGQFPDLLKQFRRPPATGI